MAQQRYLIRSEQGILGGLSFSAAAWRLVYAMSGSVGSEGTRAARLALIVGNSRFLIVPSVQVEESGLARAGLASRQLAGDWQRHHGYKPVLIESFVDSSRYPGACYRAANRPIWG
ncbi:MAG: DUF4338 domain-containing protein [Sterolibacteriaceae bacterium]|nr:DUF4338 domain-containing protein [Sterolibacteriaceae bacterium]